MSRWALFLVMSLAATARAEVRLERATRFGGGSGVRYRQTWRGLDVVGGTVYVRFDDRGLVRWSSGAAAELPADLDDTPLVDPEEAIARLGRGVFPTADHTRLVVWAPPGRRPRLAWDVLLPRDLDRMETLRGWVDAKTGELLWTQNLLMSARQARVFPSNPKASTLTTVTLDLPEGSIKLANDDIVALNCIDRMTCPLVVGGGGQHARWCETVPRALADASGDFFYDRPDSDTALEDPFSEVQMFYHATVGIDRFRELGFTRLGEEPMQAIVNLRVPPDDGAVCVGNSSTEKLSVYENAFFAPKGSFRGIFPANDAMVFGQGALVDYAYDGDVIYHELTHAVMSTITPMGLADLDARGLDPTMFGMHEGFADTFAAIIAGDPNIGEYVGPALTGDPGPLRSLENDHRCPDHLVGEPHYDSEMWSAALWQLRVALPDKEAFDRALYVVVDSLGEVESYATVQAKIVAELQTSLGAAAADTARGVFAQRGLDGCNDRVLDVAIGAPKRVLFLNGRDHFPGLAHVPAVVQLRFELKKAASEVRVTVAGSGAGEDGSSNQPSLEVLVKPGAPIVWNSETAANDAPAHAALVIETKDPRPGKAAVPGKFPPGVYFAQLTNGGPTWVVGQIVVATDKEGPGADTGGGGCSVGRRPGGAPLLILAAPLALLAGRRARRRRDRREARPSPRA